MAVVQISRIQQRRGKKNSQTGFPQLASGEMGWAIDTQELYIGNGAVSEGAPAVGNTKIITEHDDILGFADLYQYQPNTSYIQTGTTTTLPVRRTVQEKLDDVVNAKAFGVKGDTVTDDTVALQRAIDQLFLNTSSKSSPSSRVVLYLDPGVYKITDEIKIPPYAHIIGAGIDSTIIRQTMTNSTGKAVFRMVDGSSTPGNYVAFNSMNSQTTSWPRNIYITGMTLETTGLNTIMYLDNTESTVIDRVKFLGTFTNGTYPTTSQTAVTIRGTGGTFYTENVSFRNCRFLTTGYGIYSNSDHSNVTFDTCTFYQLFSAIDVGGGVYGSVNTKVSKCHFDLIDQYGFRVKPGSYIGITSHGNMSTSNMFLNVGNENQGYANAKWPIISFETEGNTSTDDYFERNTRQKDKSQFDNRAFFPNVKSSSMIHDNTGFKVLLQETPNTPTIILRFPFFNSAVYLIDYVINKTTSGTAVRTGTMMITADITGNRYNISDNFNYIGDSSVENISFSAALQNNDTGDAALDTLIVKYTNYSVSGNGVATMNYSYRLLSA
jgi:hypothetical protein